MLQMKVKILAKQPEDIGSCATSISPEAISGVNCISQYPLRQLVIEVMKCQAEQSHHFLSFDPVDRLQQIFWRVRRIHTLWNIVNVRALLCSSLPRLRVRS